MAAEWLRFVAEDREREPSTVRDYRSVLDGRLLPVFGAVPIEEITPEMVQEWRLSLGGLSNRTKNKLLIVLHNRRAVLLPTATNRRMDTSAKITLKGQITIPKGVRDELDSPFGSSFTPADPGPGRSLPRRSRPLPRPLGTMTG